jgi:hypothetical protein
VIHHVEALRPKVVSLHCAPPELGRSRRAGGGELTAQAANPARLEWPP